MISNAQHRAVLLLGVLLIGIYLLAYQLGDLRENTLAFEGLFFSAFIVYAIVCLVILRAETMDRRLLFWTFGLVAMMQGILTLTRPTLSDDMYRYVWDGRVQAQGISPYRYPPNAPELAHLRDADIYPHINRRNVVTVYPPAAEAVYALLWRILPDSVRWFQIVMSAGALTAGILLVGLLNDLGLPPTRALIFAWSPLLVFETAHSAHVDGLVLPLLVGAFWARVRARDGLTGFLLGVATAIKFYPALLLPFLWRPRDRAGRWQMPLAFGIPLGLFYLPHIIQSGGQVLGFLPDYFDERFNVGPLVATLARVFDGLGLYLPNRVTLLMLVTITVMALWAILYPARDGKTALRRCILPIGALTLFSQNLFSWYMLWLLPLIAIFLEPSDTSVGRLALPRLDAWTGWWLFCGLIALSYTFFIDWKSIHAAILAQYLPLYAFLFIDLVKLPWKLRASS